MFQHDGGFSLFGAIAEEDLDDMVLEDPFEPVPAPAPVPVTTTTPRPASVRLPLLTTPATLGRNSLLEVLQRSGSTPFWCVDSDEAIDERWKAQRGELTQNFKRMHREAVKKTRRRVAGSRASTGTTRPGAAPPAGRVP